MNTQKIEFIKSWFSEQWVTMSYKWNQYLFIDISGAMNEA